ncbi:MAG TPA: SDR family NAD(P)-dependent oxidoreductase, partial [Candidatus Nanopelagicales bacterium]|nr:SDR family NAD(P)-dependent oxidoreductase [Candidatus Nanopelagicales bacterium]
MATEGVEHPGAAIYEGLRRVGIDHGRAFQVLSRIRVDESGVLAELRGTAVRDGMILPPELVDGALQAMAAWLAYKGAEAGARLPFAIQAARLLRRDEPPSHVRVTSSDGEQFDIRLLTREGTECVVLSGVASRPAPDPLAGMLFTPGYRPTRAPLEPDSPVRPAGRRVVVLESPEAAPVVAWLLPWLSRDRVLRVSAPAGREQWRARLGQDPPDVVYHLAGLVPDDADPDDLDLLETVESRALHTLLHLVRELLDGGFRARPIQILVLVNRTRAVEAGEPLAPFAAGLHGFCRTLASEVPAWQVSCIDVVPERLRRDADRAALSALLRDCEARPRIDAVLRGDRVYEPTMEALSLPPAPSTLRHGATWLILGGAGGIGFALSRHLAATTAAKLIWIGRRAPDEEILRKRREIQAAGGQVEYVSADITDEVATREALAPALARLGPVYGVVHSALVLDDIPLKRMDEARLRRVLAPKTRGSVILRRLLRDERPEVYLFFGSAVSYTGSPGQANYAAASTYQDAYAESLAARVPGEVRVLHWGFWGNVGAVATDAYRQRLAQRGIHSIEVPEGLAAIERALSHPVRRVMAIKADDRVLEALGVSPGYALRPALEILPSLQSHLLESHPPEPLDAGRLERLQHGSRALSDLGRVLLEARLRPHGLPGPGGRITIERLRGSLDVTPSHERLLAACLSILRRHGRIAIEGGQITGRGERDLPEPEQAVEAFVRAWPELEPHARLLAVCLEALPEVVSGRRGYADVLFPGGSSERVRGIYQGNLLSDYHNALVAGLIAGYVRERLRDTPGAFIRILEIGAGTGGTSRFVLDALRPFGYAVEYHYTDVSPAFVEQGRHELGPTHPFVQFRVLDLEREPDRRGAPRRFDLAFATNVVHATRRVDRSLRHIRALLEAGGLLLLSEATGVQEFANLTFGLTTGWWLYEDEESRQAGSPLLSTENWQLACLRAGFQDPRVLGMPQLSPDSWEQLVVVAESGPLVPFFVSRASAETRSAPVPVEAQLVEPGQRTAPPVRAAAAPVVSSTSLEDRVRRHVGAIFAELLRLRDHELDFQANFEAFGVDSVMVVDLTDRLKRDLGALPSTLLFEHNTLERICQYLLRAHRPALEALLSPAPTPEPPTPGDRLVSPKPVVEVHRAPRTAELSAALPLVATTSTIPSASSAPEVADAPGDEPIAIIGVAGRYPGARDLDAFWQKLRDGASCITEIPDDRLDWRGHFDPEPGKPGRICTRWGGFIEGVAEFDPLFFKLSPREAEAMDPQERIFLQTAFCLLEDSGHTRQSIGGQDRAVGVFVGVMHGTYARVGAALRDRGVWVSANAPYWSIANRVSYLFDFQGPSYALDSACSSSLTAIHLACESLRRGECRAAIAGGVNLILHADHLRFLSTAGMLSRGDACRAFGADADGFVDGEGVGAVLLKPLRHAEADGDRILGVIAGSAINAGGKTSGYTVPNPNAHAALIRAALHRAGWDPASITYVEAHGTGTSLGDPIEIAGLTSAWREHTDTIGSCAIGSVKSNIGHLEAAAGVAGLTKVLLQLRHRELAPTLHAEPANPRIPFEHSPFRVQLQRAPWEPAAHRGDEGQRVIPLRAAISSFGAGGANAHLLVEGYERPRSRVEHEPVPRLIVVSARNDRRLEERLSALLEHLSRLPAAPELPALMTLAADVLALDPGELRVDEPLGELGFDRISLYRFREAWLERWPGRPPELGLDTTLQNLARPTEARDVPDLTDIAYTLQVGREPMEARVAFVARDLLDAQRQLAACLAGPTEAIHRGTVSRLAPDAGRDQSAARAAAEGDLEKLASLWVQGARIDWASLYSSRPARVALPTYPFARDSYWVPWLEPVPSASPLATLPPATLPPATLEGPLLSGASTGAIVFLKRIGLDHPICREHRVQGRAILPGVATLALLTAAVALLPDAPRPFAVEDLTWVRPAEVDADPIRLHLDLRPCASTGATFRLERPDQNGAGASCLAQGRIVPRSASAELPPLDVEEISGRCLESLDGPACYARFSAVGIELGRTFQRLQWVRRGEGQALARMTPADDDSELGQWAVMDGALQAVSFLVEAPGSGPAPLPFALGRYFETGDVRATTYSHVRRLGPDRFEVTLADENGRVLARIEELTMRTGKEAFPALFFAPRWRRTAAELDPPPAGAPLAIVATPDALEPARALLGHLPAASSRVVPLDARAGTALMSGPPFERLALLAIPRRGDRLSEEETLDLTLQVFHLVKHLIETGWVLRPHRLTLVTRRTRAVFDDDRIEPTGAALPG